MTQTALDEAARLLARRVGLRLDPTVRGRLARAVRDEAERLGANTMDYVARLNRDPAALQDLLNRVTVQETSFFRDPGQFLAFVSDVLPELSAAGAAVHVWSAGCANGQEAYSLAMVLAESGFTNWQVIATDISTKALARTAAASYSGRELAGLSLARRSQHMIPVDGASDRWEIAPELRKRVLSLRHNLASDPPPMAATPCQVVFCRNVLIYFGHDEVVAFLNRLSTWLPAGAYLFLGYSESLWLVSERFHLIRLGDAFVYRNGPAEHSTAVQRPVRVEGPAPAPATSDVETPPRQPLQQAAARFDPRPLGLLAEGESAMGERDYARAVTAFRKASFLDPDQPLGYLSLGLALEAMGDMAAAQRAYAAARASVERCDVTAIETTLDGYQLHEFTRMLDLKTGAS